MPTAANRQPAVATYVRRGEEEPHLPAFAISVLAITGGQVTEVTGFHTPVLYPAFGLPQELLASDR